MKQLILLFIIFQSLLSFGQSKNEIIEEALRKEKVLLRKVDSLQLMLNSSNTKLKTEKTISNDQLAQITKLNFETADLRITMYKHVASIDSLVRLLDARTKQNETLEMKYSKCEDEKRMLSQRDQPSGNENSERELVSDVDFTKMTVTSTSSFKFNLTINAMGAVMDVQLIAKNSTDSDLLKHLIEEIKKQVRYRPNPGAEMINIEYSCSISPN